MIEAELRQRGVTREVIEAYREEHAAPERAPEDEGLPGDELARAGEALARHLRGRPLPVERAAQQRIGMYLVRRGFDPDTVRAALRAATATDDLSDLAE
jgi:SOS response regulatory protein OraA/RecX